MPDSFDHPSELSRRIAWLFYLTAAFVLAAGVAVLWSLAAAGLDRTYAVGLVATVGVAAAFAVSAWWVRRGRLRSGIGLAAAALAAAAVGLAIGTGRGVHTVVLGGLGAVVIVCSVVIGRRFAAVLAAALAVALVAIFAAGAGGLLAPPAPMLTPNLLLAQLMLLGMGLLFGLMASAVVEASAQRLKAREQRFRALLGIASDWYWEQDAQFRFTRVDAWHAVLGTLSEADVHGKTRWELADQATTPEQWAEHRATLNAHRPFRDFVFSVTAGGQRAHLSVSGEPVFDSNGAFSGYWGVGRGVTAEVEARLAAQASERRNLEVAGERMQVEERLARSETMLARLFEASPDAICISELETGKMLLANERFCSMLGHPRKALIDRSSLELGIWAKPAQRHLVIEALQAKGAVRNLPITLRTRDGRTLTTILSAATMAVDDRTLMVSILRDVTANAQSLLRQQAILKYASIGIAFTRNRVFEQANPRFEEMFGWPPGTLVGQPGAVVWRSEEDYAQIGRIAGPLLGQGLPVDFERLMRRREGGEFWCRIRARAVDPEHPATGGTIWIAENITDSRATAQALAAAKEAAEEANRAKSAFLANMSHEIRTPLNGVLGLARLASKAEGGSALQRDYLQRLVESTEGLGAIISDILDLSKIEAGKLAIESVAFDLRQLINSACAALRELAAVKAVSFELTIDEAVPQRVTGDPVRVRQILANFVSNAIKFTERGRIEIRVSAPRAGCVRLAVSDTGIGIDDAVRGRLFRPFSQGDDTTTRRFGGTGLGLSICRELAALMGGEVGFDSTSGVGSTFWAELPLPAATAEVKPARPPIDDAQPLDGLRVLLVEDNPVNMLIAEQLLVHWGATVTQASDGRQAIEAVDKHSGEFDAVLMDVHMPVMGGNEATRALRARFDRDELPIVALTAAALASEQQASLDAGMNDFIAKPIDAQRMIDVLLRVTEARRTARSGAAGPAPTST